MFDGTGFRCDHEERLDIREGLMEDVLARDGLLCVIGSVGSGIGEDEVMILWLSALAVAGEAAACRGV